MSESQMEQLRRRVMQYEFDKQKEQDAWRDYAMREGSKRLDYSPKDAARMAEMEGRRQRRDALTEPWQTAIPGQRMQWGGPLQTFGEFQNQTAVAKGGMPEGQSISDRRRARTQESLEAASADPNQYDYMRLLDSARSGRQRDPDLYAAMLRDAQTKRQSGSKLQQWWRNLPTK